MRHLHSSFAVLALVLPMRSLMGSIKRPFFAVFILLPARLLELPEVVSGWECLRLAGGWARGDFLH